MYISAVASRPIMNPIVMADAGGRYMASEEREDLIKSIASITQVAFGAAAKNARDAAAVVSQRMSDTSAAIDEAAAKGEQVIEDAKAKRKPTLNEELEAAFNRYNVAYSALSDSGIRLFQERLRTADALANVELLINSVANTPKSFATDVAEVKHQREDFGEANDITERELRRAKEIAAGEGVGVAAGAAVAALAPSAALWVATTFGTASTGTAISALSGAAATKAALAWLGGGALAAGGGGMAAGNALLALAGPVGWSIAGASVLAGVVLYARNKAHSDKEKQAAIESANENAEEVAETAAAVESVRLKTTGLREDLTASFADAMPLYGSDYSALCDDDKMRLGALVNNAKSAAALLCATVERGER